MLYRARENYKDQETHSKQYSHLKDAKIHRFKEAGFWRFDEKKYYSNKSQKYIIYENRKTFENNPATEEKLSLITALTLGKILNRVVILPKFHCSSGCKSKACLREDGLCAFYAHFHVERFNRYFANLYREHSFLSHSKVPENVKKSISPEIHVIEKKLEDKLSMTSNATVVFNKRKKKLSTNDVISWFGTGNLSEFSVLNFHSLYYQIQYPNKQWRENISKALLFCNYNQRFGGVSIS